MGVWTKVIAVKLVRNACHVFFFIDTFLKSRTGRILVTDWMWGVRKRSLWPEDLEGWRCHLLRWERLRTGLGRCGQQLSFRHAKFEKIIRNPRFASLYKQFLNIYHESDGFVLKLDRISCMLLKLHKHYKKEKI